MMAWADPSILYGLCGAALAGIGLFGFIARRDALRRVVGFNVAGSGVFLLFGATGFRGAGMADPVPQALIITGIVVAMSATALVTALVVRLAALDREAATDANRQQDGEEPARTNPS